MATTADFIEYVCDQIESGWNIRYKKMFGEYMVYVNEKPLLLVCDNTVFVKQLECISPLLEPSSKGFPYKGAKEHYVIDPDDRELLNSVIRELEKVIPVPVKKRKKMGEDAKSIHDFDFNLICEYFSGIGRQGPGSPEVTVKALGFIEGLTDKSLIADIGCGTGGQTVVLADHTSGRITGIDLSPIFIDMFNDNMKKANLCGRVKGITGSMDNLSFRNEELDLIWSEGAIYNIGFERGLSEWKQFLKRGGYIAVTDAAWLTEKRPDEINDFWNNAYPGIDTVSNRISIMQKAGYIPVASFLLPENCWTDNFYIPQAAMQEKFLEKHRGNRAAEELVENEKHESRLYDRYKDFYGYVFFIGRKI